MSIHAQTDGRKPMEASIPGVGTDSTGSSCGLFALEPPQDMMICIAFEFADLLPGFSRGISARVDGCRLEFSFPEYCSWLNAKAGRLVEFRFDFASLSRRLSRNFFSIISGSMPRLGAALHRSISQILSNPGADRLEQPLLRYFE